MVGQREKGGRGRKAVNVMLSVPAPSFVQTLTQFFARALCARAREMLRFMVCLGLVGTAAERLGAIPAPPAPNLN
jgi:hypothetical protein